jgi:HK97 family phage portal protein
MNLLKIFNSGKEVDKLKTELDEIKKELKASSDLSNSLLAFSNGNVYRYNTTKSETYSDHYTIYRGIDLLSSLGSALPYNLYLGDEQIKSDSTLPGGFNLTKPNPFMSFNSLNYNALVYFFYRGEYMIEIVEDPLLHLVPLNPKKMTFEKNGMWKYDEGNNRRFITPDNLIYVKMLNPDNAERGLSPIDVVKEDIENEKSAINYNTSYFKNHGQIGGYFYDQEGKAKTEDMQNIIKQFNTVHQGENNAYKTLGLPRGIRYEDFKQTMAEMQYLESRKDIRDRILAILGIHKSLFGVTDQVNRSVSEEATRMLWLHNLKPRLVRVQEAWQRVFFNRFFPAYTFEYDFSSIPELKQSFETIEKQAMLLKNLGYTTNEINNVLKLGMDEIKDPALDTRVIPNSLVPFDYLTMSENQEAKNKNKTIKASVDSEKILDEYFQEDEIEKLKATVTHRQQLYIRNIRNLMRNTEKSFTGKLGKFFASELGDIIKIVLGDKQADTNIDVNTILAKINNKINENKTKVSTTLKPVYEEASVNADKLAKDYLKDKTEAVVAQDVVDSLVNKITNISNHTYKLIRNQIKDGITAGETIESIANRIKSVYKFNSSRARMIARTETTKVIESTTDKRYREAGVEKKQWINSEDEQSRDSHSQNASIGVVDYDYIYPTGQRHPGEGPASEVINCRCTTIPVISNT